MPRPRAAPKREQAEAGDAPRALRRASSTDIQRELARRGFYDGVVDGRYGPKTDAAIRDFEQAAGLKAEHRAERGVAARDQALADPVTPRHPLRGRNAVRPGRSDRRTDGAVEARGRGAARARRIRLRPDQADRIVDAETQAAIQKFERERKLPVTGQMSDRVVRELAAITGRPLE